MAAQPDQNTILVDDLPAHRWYRFVLSYPPHIVRQYVQRFGVTSSQCVLDPFCGTGTTLVECKKLGIPSVGVEANPVAAFASGTKLNWAVDPAGLVRHAQEVAAAALAALRADGIEDNAWIAVPPRSGLHLRQLPPHQAALLLTSSISPLPLHKTLVLMEHLAAHADPRYRDHELLALAKALVYSASNLKFGPEVGVGKPKVDAAVVAPWLAAVREMADDLPQLQARAMVSSVVHHADARDIAALLPPGSVDAVITSPPYPNEKDYTRTTRLEMVLLGFVENMAELRQLKRGLVRSNTRSVYVDDTDDTWVQQHPQVQRLAAAIEARRVELGKTSGFERTYHRVTKLYFGGMARHLAALRPALRPGAQLAYVVGDQASYLRVMIRTGQVLAELAAEQGYEVLGIDLFRTRLATATREQLREEVVLLRWPGERS